MRSRSECGRHRMTTVFSCSDQMPRSDLAEGPSATPVNEWLTGLDWEAAGKKQGRYETTTKASGGDCACKNNLPRRIGTVERVVR